MKQKICALIAARGGSKGIPKKNLRKLDRLSLIQRSAREAAGASFDAVYVYSDDSEILEEGRLGGAIPVNRPGDIAADNTTTEATVRRFLEDHDENKEYSAVAVIQCTTPFLKTEHIEKCLQLFRGPDDHDSVITVARFNRFLGYSGAKTGKWIPIYPYRFLRQEFAEPPFFIENGGVYLARRKLWQLDRRIGDKCGWVEMGWWESVEIDDWFDLAVARALVPHIGKEPGKRKGRKRK